MSEIKNIKTKINSIADTGGKIVYVEPIIIFDDITPPTVWTDIDISAFIPVGTIMVFGDLVIQKNGTDRSFSISKPSVRNVYEWNQSLASETTQVNYSYGATGVSSDRKISVNASTADFDFCRIYMNAYLIPVAQT